MTSHTKHALLLLEIPRTNDRKELAAEQMFAALHGILKPVRELTKGQLQDQISFEIVSIGQRIRFYVHLPKTLQSFLEGQVYAQYPTAQISEITDDYCNRQLSQNVIYTTDLCLIDAETIPIKTFPSFEVDPLAAITATLAKLDQPNEEIWLQIIVRPISDDWHKKSAKMANKIKNGKEKWSKLGAGVSMVGQFVSAMVNPPTTGVAKVYEPSERDKTRIAAIEEKSRKLGYQVKMRILYAGNDEHTARLRMQAMVGTFKQYNTTNLNGFIGKFASFEPAKLVDYQTRLFTDKGYILNIEELASLYHLPHTSVETPNIVWATTKTSEPPATLPTFGKVPEEEISLFGTTNFRGSNTMFGLLRTDRGRHVYILGQTGAGKSGLLELLTLSDVFYNQGFGLIDPHGDYATAILRYIPERRMRDVIYFNPADTDFPIGFNPLEITDAANKGQVSSELVGVLKRMFDSWGPRLEYILRYSILALLDYPGATMLDITKMLTDKKFRKEVVDNIDDPVVKNFWITEFGSWTEKFANEAVAPILNKVGAFTANPIIRNIIGQKKSTFNIREIMDSGKIFIVNLSQGLIGEDNASVLGAMLITKIQLAAMSRSDIPNVKDRRPFYLYVDEFQNFATDSFAKILSEARKYGLNLTIANQYISQIEETVRGAVFGNVGTMITFRVSPEDSPFLSKYYEPQFEPADLSNFKNRDFVTSMSVNGEKVVPFSGRTLSIPESQQNNTKDIIEYSRMNYSTPKANIEGIIREANTPTTHTVTNNHSKSQTSGIKPPVIGRAVLGTATTSSSEEKPTQILSESQKRRLRRKKAAEAHASESTSEKNTNS